MSFSLRIRPKKYNVLVIGKDSMLGHDVMEFFTRKSLERDSCINFVYGTTHSELDVTERYALDRFFCGTNLSSHIELSRGVEHGSHAIKKSIRAIRRHGNAVAFDVVVNCAAMTDTRGAELDDGSRHKSYWVNALGPRYLAEACNRWGTKLIHISTDYVFSEFSHINYDFKPWSVEYPVNNYGIHKLLGELFVKQSMKPKDLAILRTSWLYGAWKNKSFVHRFLANAAGKLADAAHEETVEMEIPVNEVSVPTSTVELAQMIYNTIKYNLSGVLHAGGLSQKGVNRLEWATAILDSVNSISDNFTNIKVIPPPSSPNEKVITEKPMMKFPCQSYLGTLNILNGENTPRKTAIAHRKLTEGLEYHWRDSFSIWFHNNAYKIMEWLGDYPRFHELPRS